MMRRKFEGMLFVSGEVSDVFTQPEVNVSVCAVSFERNDIEEFIL